MSTNSDLAFLNYIVSGRKVTWENQLLKIYEILGKPVTWNETQEYYERVMNKRMPESKFNGVKTLIETGKLKEAGRVMGPKNEYRTLYERT